MSFSSSTMNYTLLNITTVWPNGTLDMTSPAVIASVAGSSFAILISLIAAILIIVKKNAIEVRLAQPRTSFITYAGLAILNAGVLTGIQRPMSMDWCMCRMWAFQLAAVLVMSSVVLKAWRLWRLDRNAKMTPVKLSQEGFMSILGLAVVTHIGVLIFWSLFEAPYPTWPDGDGCSSDGWIGQAIALSILFLLWVLWTWWSIATLHLGAKLTETAWASAIVGAMAGLTGVGAAYLGPGSASYLKNGPILNSITRQTMESMAATAFTLSLVIFGLIPKFSKPFSEYEHEIFDDMNRKRTVFRRPSNSSNQSRGRRNYSTKFSTSASSLANYNYNFAPEQQPYGIPPPSQEHFYSPTATPPYLYGSMLGENSDLVGAVEEPYMHYNRSFPVE